jgi:K+-transporting ATPase A subunit
LSPSLTSTGAVIAAHDSLMPLVGLVLIFNMQMGEIGRDASGMRAPS